MAAETDIKNILILDDNRDFRALIKTYLQKDFQNTDIVEYDPVARGAPPDDFDWGAYDVMILDYYLCIYGLTGLDLLQKHRKKPGFPATIMLTGAGNEAVAVRALKFGVNEYLSKVKLSREVLAESIVNAYKEHVVEREKYNKQERANNSFDKVLFYKQLEHQKGPGGDGPERAFLLVDVDNYNALAESIGLIVRDNLVNHIAQNSYEIFNLIKCNPNITRFSDSSVGLLIDFPGSTKDLEVNTQELCSQLATRPYKFGDKLFDYTVSIGVLHLKNDGNTVETLVNQINLARDIARQNPANSYHIYTGSEILEIEKRRKQEEERHKEEKEKLRLAELKKQKEEKERHQQEEEQRRKEEERKIHLAELEKQRLEEEKRQLQEDLRRKEEQLRLAELENKRQEEVQRQLKEDQRHKEEQLRLAALEKQRQEDEKRQLQEALRLKEEQSHLAELKKQQQEKEKRQQEEKKELHRAQLEKQRLEEEKRQLQEDMRRKEEQKRKENEKELQRVQLEKQRLGEEKRQLQEDLRHKGEQLRLAELEKQQQEERRKQEDEKRHKEQEDKLHFAELERQQLEKERHQQEKNNKPKEEAMAKKPTTKTKKVEPEKMAYATPTDIKSSTLKTKVIQENPPSLKMVQTTQTGNAKLPETKQADEETEIDVFAFPLEIISSADTISAPTSAQYDNKQADVSGDEIIINESELDGGSLKIKKAFDNNRGIQIFQPIITMSTSESKGSSELFKVALELIDIDGSVTSANDVKSQTKSLSLQQYIDHWMLRKLIGRIVNSDQRTTQKTYLITIGEAWLADITLFNWLKKLLTGMENIKPGQYIVLEISEEILSRHKKRAVPLITTLKKLYGFQIALGKINNVDGVKKLSKEINFDLLVFDYNYVTQIRDSIDNKTNFLSDMKGKGTHIIVDGIENSIILTDAISAGADYVMGNFIGEPQSHLSKTVNIESFEIS